MAKRTSHAVLGVFLLVAGYGSGCGTTEGRNSTGPEGTGGNGASGTGGGVTSGGSGGGATSGGTTGGGTTGTGGESAICAALGEVAEEALAAAKACDPASGSAQCDGSEVVPTTGRCNCGTIVNSQEPSKAQAARDAYESWVAGGCKPP